MSRHSPRPTGASPRASRGSACRSLEALAYAHGQGVLHRDIKPSNLLLDRDGNVWVADFGLAKATGTDDLTHTGDIVGTVRYMAPERFHGESDARSDLYALGLTLYELLALRPAFDESDRASLMRQVTQEDPPRLRRLNGRVPLDLETIIHKAIAREPGQRYASAERDGRRPRAVPGRPADPGAAGFRPPSASIGGAGATRSSRPCSAWSPFYSLPVSSARLRRRFTSGMTAASESAARHDAELARIQAGVALKQAVEARGEADRRRQEAEASSAQARAKQQEAEASFALARKAVDDSFTKVSESTLLAVPGMRPLRRDLLESALAFYEEFLRRQGDDPSILADLAVTQFRVGQILADLSEQEKARVALRRSVELYDKALAARPGDVAMLERQSEVWHRLGDLDYRTDKPTANKAYHSAVAIRERLAADAPARAAVPDGAFAVVQRSGDHRRFRRRSVGRLSSLARAAAEARRRDPRGSRPVARPLRVVPQPGISCSGTTGHREEALELVKHAIEYGRAAVGASAA